MGCKFIRSPFYFPRGKRDHSVSESYYLKISYRNGIKLIQKIVSTQSLT